IGPFLARLLLALAVPPPPHSWPVSASHPRHRKAPGPPPARSRDLRSPPRADTQVMPRRLGLVIAVLLLAGCGSTQVTAEPPEPQTSPTTFRSDARPVCRAPHRRVAARA